MIKGLLDTAQDWPPNGLKGFRLSVPDELFAQDEARPMPKELFLGGLRITLYQSTE